jgi:hypothetical protein
MKENQLKMMNACQTSDPCRNYGGKVSGCAGSLTSIGGNHKLNPTAAKAYLNMVEDAKSDGVEWKITDSFRPLKIQCNILDWEQFKKSGTKRKKGTSGTPVAFPGNSNHGWGSAVDLAVKYGDKAHKWLTENASKFGFSNPFKNPRTEPWHWEHVESAKVLKSGASLPDSGSEVKIPTDTEEPTTKPADKSLMSSLPFEDLMFGAGFSEFAKEIFKKKKGEKPEDEEPKSINNLTEEVDRFKDILKKIL